MPSGPMGDEPDTHRILLRCRNCDVLHFAIARHSPSPLGQAVLRSNLVPVVLDHVVDTESRRPLLAGLGQKDDIAVECNVETLHQQHQH